MFFFFNGATGLSFYENLLFPCYVYLLIFTCHLHLIIFGFFCPLISSNYFNFKENTALMTLFLKYYLDTSVVVFGVDLRSFQFFFFLNHLLSLTQN